MVREGGRGFNGWGGWIYDSACSWQQLAADPCGFGCDEFMKVEDRPTGRIACTRWKPVPHDEGLGRASGRAAFAFTGFELDVSSAGGVTGRKWEKRNAPCHLIRLADIHPLNRLTLRRRRGPS